MKTLSYINFWPGCEQTIRWFEKFIKVNICDVKRVSNDENPDILLCSVFGDITNALKIKAKVKILFSGERMNSKPYSDNELMKSTFDIILGFKYTNLSNKTLRFPLWLVYYNYYNMQDENNTIITHLEQEYQKNIREKKPFFATLIARHGALGTRQILMTEMEKHGKVICPANFNNNYERIKQGRKAKIDFAKKALYSICPENNKDEGYFTEKIFQAFEAGTIPIYWAIDEPEKEILNKNKYCFIKNINDEKEVAEKIEQAVQNPQEYISGPIFTEKAKSVIEGYYRDVINQIKISLSFNANIH